MMLRQKLSDALDVRVEKYGDDFLARFKRGCLSCISPAIHNVPMFIGNARTFIKPKLTDGSTNPLWPEGVETPPRDDTERAEFFQKLTEAHLGDWLRRVEAGEFDRPPEIEATADPEVEQRLSADDLEEQPETEVVGAEELEEEIKLVKTVNEYDDGESTQEEEKETVMPEGASQEKLDAVAKASKKRAEDPNEPHPVIRLREAIEDIARGAIDVRAFGNVQEMIDLVQSLKDEVGTLKGQIGELQKRCDAQKKFIQKHHADIEELKNPKKPGGMDDL
jgi:flagellin-like hook-associated protein FlgL